MDVDTDARQAYEQAAEGKLAEWRAQIDQLRGQASDSDAGTTFDHQTEVEKLQGQLEITEQQLQFLKAASSGAWPELKEGVDTKMEILEDSLERTSAAVKGE